ncbi:Predicted DNA-binding transcriptional regulator YafY, contains an HTH and WYL domains [Micromonospora citrea]|uniref:Predicted DNA-binding transcriptional regulator YafY, contains an HTH and WYL domains n=1 Tax=Micromonospora citrea TaxID=47855 RepID=A0A1C6W3E2_9ACTN|nr:YafY family protein [Micromonospora citrea]SCL73022.1 Predicted DNA-binding transcriptional regulator YafY, contains an HTH and WYL domains [Micromonospora citrea]
MRASRLISLLMLLQAHGRMTAAQLAERLEVSTRTVYRDVEALHTAGIPLYGEAGHAGGYRLVEGWRTRLTGLTAQEAERLFLAGLPGPAAELGYGAAVAALQLKLHAALPPELADRAARIQERFHLDTPNWYADGDTSPHLPDVAEAVWRQRRIAVRYRSWAGEVDRVLEPYGLVLKGGRWYAVAGRPGRDEPATYRVNQVLSLTTSDEEFTRPAGFDLPAWWREHVARFRAHLHRDDATVRLSPRGRERLREVASELVAASAERTAGPPDDAGWVTAVIPIESLTHAHGDLLRLGADVEVLAPAALRERLAATAADLAALYAPRPVPEVSPPPP